MTLAAAQVLRTLSPSSGHAFPADEGKRQPRAAVGARTLFCVRERREYLGAEPYEPCPYCGCRLTILANPEPPACDHCPTRRGERDACPKCAAEKKSTGAR